MKPEDIKIDDWLRIFVGEVPPEFFIEILIRVTFLYLLLLISMRLLGKRLATQLTRNELAALVSLAAAIGVPILGPDRGILPALVIAALVTGVSRLIARIVSGNEKVEKIAHGKIGTLVKDAVLDPHSMMHNRISKERILAELRTEKITHLGEVQRLFIEANGIFTLIKTESPWPGLAVLPETDTDFIKERLVQKDTLVCHTCGMQKKGDDKHEKCSNCRDDHWVAAFEKRI